MPVDDGKIIYDPYGPSGCSIGGGRWIVVEDGKVCLNNSCTNGFVLAVSQGEDPTPSTPLTTNYYYAWFPSFGQKRGHTQPRVQYHLDRHSDQ